MTVTKTAAQKLAQELKCRNDGGESWRKIAAGYGELVKAGTLCRIAGEGGTWLPKDKEILRALGLIETKARLPLAEEVKRYKKAIRRMARATNDAVVRRKSI